MRAAFSKTALCVAVKLLLASGLTSSYALAKEDAAMFRGDPGHTGIFNTTAPSSLNLKWDFATGESILSSPTILNGTVYVGSSDNKLYAIDAKTGQQKWQFQTQGNVASSPAVSANTVFVLSLDGKLYALDAASGSQKWAFATEGEHRFTAPGVGGLKPSTEMMPDPWDLFISSPTVTDGIVYFGSGDNHVYAVDATTGVLKWKYKTGNVVHASPAVANGLVYIGSFDTYFYALDAATGELVWKFKTKDDPETHLMAGIPGSAAVGNGLVYFGCRDANVYALDAKNGAVRWQFSVGQTWVIASPAVVGEEVFFTTSDTHKFEVLNALTGAEKYALPYHIFSFSSPAIAGDHAYFGSFDGTVYAVDLKTKEYSGTFSAPGLKLNGPRFLDKDGEPSQTFWTGETLDDVIISLRAKLFSLGSILSSPCVADGVVYVGSTDGHLYALGR